MNERFDVEAVLRDVLDVLRRHSLPIETASLNVSFLDAAFDESVPQLRNYKAGILYRPLVIDQVPVLFQAQRRYPFDEIVQALEQEIKPPIETFTKALQRDYPALNINGVSARVTPSSEVPNMLDADTYRLGVDCQFSDDVHTDYNKLELRIWLQQRVAATYPRLSAYVGWLVDEESRGDWGVDIVDNAIVGAGDYAPHQVELLRTALQSFFKSFRHEIVRKLSGELTYDH